MKKIHFFPLLQVSYPFDVKVSSKPPQKKYLNLIFIRKENLDLQPCIINSSAHISLRIEKAMNTSALPARYLPKKSDNYFGIFTLMQDHLSRMLTCLTTDLQNNLFPRKRLSLSISKRGRKFNRCFLLRDPPINISQVVPIRKKRKGSYLSYSVSWNEKRASSAISGKKTIKAGLALLLHTIVLLLSVCELSGRIKE